MLVDIEVYQIMFDDKEWQAGAELCQDQLGSKLAS